MLHPLSDEAGPQLGRLFHRIGLILFSLILGLVGSDLLAASLSISPGAVFDDHTGNVSLSITGLSPGKTVLVERFLDANGDGAINAAEDRLIASFRITDGVLPLIAGVRNVNVPGDDDGTTNSAIRVDFPFPSVDIFNKSTANFIFRVSDPQNTFTPVTAVFQVTQKSQPQKVTGQITAASGGAPLAGAIVVLDQIAGDSIAATLTDASGNYSLFGPPGSFRIFVLRNGFVSNESAGAVTIVANQTATKNMALANASFTLSGRLTDKSTGAGIPGVFIIAQSLTDSAGGSTDVGGNYSFAVTAGQWEIKTSDNQLAQGGYLRPEKVTITTAASGAATVNFVAPRASALIYGTVKDGLNNPVIGLGIRGEGPGRLYTTQGASLFPNGNYTLGVLAGSWNFGVGSDDLALRGYIGREANVSLSAGQAIASNLVILPVTAHLRGHLNDNLNAPIADMQLVSYDQAGNQINISTDSNGNFDAGVRAGTWEIDLECNHAQKRGYVEVGGNQFTVTDGADQNNIPLTVPLATATIGGSVKDNAGHPIPGVELNANQTISGNLFYNPGCVATDNNGNYTLKVLGGSWDVSVDANGLNARGFNAVANQNVTISGSTATANFIATQLPPVITSPLTATATVGQLFVYQITGSSNPDSFGATPLPANFSLNSTQGLIGGVPTTSGTTQVTISATNSSGTGSDTLTITVQPAPVGPSIVSGTTATARTGQPFTFSVLTANASSAAQLTSDDLPSGLSLNASSGLISGTVMSDGNFVVHLLLTDGAATATATLQLTFVSSSTVPIVTCTGTCSNGGVILVPNQSFSYTLTADAAATFSYIGIDGVQNGALPPGLSYDPATHTISGKYTGGPVIGRAGRSIEPDTIRIVPPLLAICQVVADNGATTGRTGTGPLNFFAAPGFSFSFDPPDIAFEATGPTGAIVTFPIPTASDGNGHSFPVTCDATSGTLFPFGPTLVTCTATDNAGTAGTASFNVTVQDTTTPTITVPANMTAVKEKISKNQPQGAHVTFAVSATDTVDGTVTATPDHASGSLFPLGTTTVKVTAVDGHGNIATKNFTVNVVTKLPKPPKAPTVIVAVNSSSISEGGDAIFTVTGTTVNPSQAVTVSYAMSGTANPGANFYTLSSGQITIPPGQSSGSVTLHAISNPQSSGSETAVMTLSSGSGYKVGTTKSATVTINNIP